MAAASAGGAGSHAGVMKELPSVSAVCLCMSRSHRPHAHSNACLLHVHRQVLHSALWQGVVAQSCSTQSAHMHSCASSGSTAKAVAPYNAAMGCRTCFQTWEHHPRSSARRRSHSCSSRGMGRWDSCTGNKRVCARAQPTQAHLRGLSHTPMRSQCRRAISPSFLQTLLGLRSRSSSRASRHQV